MKLRLRANPWPLMALVGLPLLYWALLAPRGLLVEIAAKTWRHAIEIERYQLELESDWCDRLPPNAELLEQRRMEDPLGQRGVDAYCRYRALRWSQYRHAVAQGEAPQPPHWPQPQLADLPPDTPGAERLGRRTTRYQWVLRAEDGQEWPCTLSLPEWRTLETGTKVRVLVDRWGTADCATLPLS